MTLSGVAGTFAVVVADDGGVASRAIWTIVVPFCLLLAVLAVVVIVKENTGSADAAAVARDEIPTVVMEGLAFGPKRLTVARGGRGDLRQQGRRPHTVTADEGSTDSGVIDPGKAFELVVNEPKVSTRRTSSRAPTRRSSRRPSPGTTATAATCTRHACERSSSWSARTKADPTKADVDDAEAAVARGPGGGVSTLALGTGVIGAFLGGFGISQFVRNKPGA